jgi:glucose-6-phosphate 1-dehydrogenase
METNVRPESTVFLIFGAAGDLTWRKLIPALYNLYLDDWMPKRFMVLGLDRVEMKDDEFRDHLRDGVEKNSRRHKVDEERWSPFAENLFFTNGDFGDDKFFGKLAKELAEIDKNWDEQANRIFYLAVPPTLVENIVQKLGKAKLNQEIITWARRRCRIFWPSVSAMRFLNHCGTGTTSITCRLPWRSQWAWNTAAVTMTRQAPSAT